MSFYDRNYIQWHLNALLDMETNPTNGLPIPEVQESDMIGFALLNKDNSCSNEPLLITRDEYYQRHLFQEFPAFLPNSAVLKLCNPYNSRSNQCLALMQVFII
jgi:hypothetical protein